MSGLEEMSREELIELVRAQARTISRQDALIARLAAMVDALEEEKTALVERVARLERALSRNSGNSGFPSSGDDQPGKPAPKDKPAPKTGRDGVKRKPGKQNGAPGAHLAWSEEPGEIADTFDRFPEGGMWVRRRSGGRDRSGSDRASPADRGSSGHGSAVPARSAHGGVPVRCGAVHTAPRPEGVPDAAVSFGVNLQTLCVYLMVAHAIPVQRCAELVESLTGAKPSQGFVHGLLKRAAAAPGHRGGRHRS